MSVSVILAQSETMVLDALTRALSLEHDLKVQGVARDGRAAISMARRQRPDVVVVDATLAGLNGVDTVERIRREAPEIRLLGMGARADDEVSVRMLRAGASGFVERLSGTVAELAAAIRSVAKGGTHVPEPVAEQLVLAVRNHRQVGEFKGPLATLTQREREVLQLLAEGNTATQTATILHISPSTVATHRDAMKRKLGTRSDATLVLLAVRHGLVPG